MAIMTKEEFLHRAVRFALAAYMSEEDALVFVNESTDIHSLDDLLSIYNLWYEVVEDKNDKFAKIKLNGVVVQTIKFYDEK